MVKKEGHSLRKRGNWATRTSAKREEGVGSHRFNPRKNDRNRKLEHCSRTPKVRRKTSFMEKRGGNDEALGERKK